MAQAGRSRKGEKYHSKNPTVFVFYFTALNIYTHKERKARRTIVIVILIAGIFPRASSNGAHGSQTDDSTYLVSDMRCSLYLTLDQQVVFSVARITGVANLPLRMWSSSKKHQLILTLAPGPGVEPGARGHEADALPLSYPHILYGEPSCDRNV